MVATLVRCRHRANTAYDLPMIEVQATAEVAAPQHLTFDFVADIDQHHTWQPGVTRCRWTTESPLASGSSYDKCLAPFGHPTPVEVVEFEPDYRIRLRSEGPLLRSETIREVGRLSGGGSKVRTTVRAEPDGWLLVFAFALRWVLRAQVHREALNLQRLLDR